MFTIFTDTSANLPTPYVKKHNVQVIPFTYFMEGVEHCCLDTETFDSQTYFAKIKQGVEVTTSQIPPQRYIESFTPVLERGEDVLFVSMSSGISGSYASAVIAAEQLRPEYPERKICLVDTLAASLGEGIIVMDAIALRDAGKEADEAEKILKDSLQSLYQTVLLDDLKHLHRTGRISGKAAVIGSVLNIKPILKGSPEGQLVVSGKVRGKKNGLQHLAKLYAELSTNQSEQTVCIAYTDSSEDADCLAKLIKAAAPPKDIMIVCYEPVTGSHLGPGSIALFFKGADGVREK